LPDGVWRESFRRISVSGKKLIDEDIRDKAQDFRDTEIEYQVMAYILRVNPLAISAVDSSWFSDIILQDIFEIANDLRMLFSRAMLMTELKDRSKMPKKEEGLYSEVVNQLFDDIDINILNDKNVRHMMTQLLRLYETRKVLVGCGEVISTIRKFDLDSAKRKLYALGKPVTLFDTRRAGDYLQDYGERVDTITSRAEVAGDSEDSLVGIKTGIFRFDKFTGGVMPTEFGVVVGMTGVGKTAALIEFGVTAWEDGHDVMVCSGEMDKQSLEFRIDSRITRIHGMKFRNADLDDDEYKKWDSTIKMYRAKYENRLYVVSYPRRFTVNDIESDILRIEEETGRKIQLLCLDYINIMEPVRSPKGDWRDQSEAVWDFKSLLAEHNIAGWTAGQVKDDAYDKELYDPQDAKYARAISEAAPIMVGLIRTPKDILEKRMKFQIIKMRNTPIPTRPILLTPNLNIMRLNEHSGTHKSLKGRQSDFLDVKKKTRTARPRKSLHGK
jgi:replicative DNA helicase